MKGIAAELACLELQGKDARDFIHRLTTVNAQRLQVGHGTRGLLLTATGKVLASFILLQKDTSYCFFSSPLEIASLTKEFEKLHFGEALGFREPKGFGYHVRAEQLNAETLGDFFSFTLNDGTISWPSPYGQGLRTIWSERELILEADEPNFWQAARIQALCPALEREWMIGESNALDVGFTAWIHENKGCYPGQEVIERSLRVGHPSRSLILVEGAVNLAAGDLLFVDELQVGKITSALSQQALALVQWKHKNSGTKFFVKRAGARMGEVECLK